MVNKVFKVLYILGMPAIIAATMFILYIAYLFLFPPPPPIQYEAPIRVVNSPIKQGDAIELEVHRCADEDVFIDANVEYIGPEIRLVEQSHYLIPKGCATVISRNNVVPDDLTPGNYKLVIILFEQTTATKHFNDRLETEEFTIVPK